MQWNIFARSIVSVSALLMLSPVALAQTATAETSRGISIRSRTQPPDLEAAQVRDGFIKEVDRFAGQQLSSEALDFATWRSRTIADLEQWLARIVFPKL
jgi:hypothetical protein